LKHKWVGELSIIDKKINGDYQEFSKVQDFKLEKDFVITSEDFLNLFASAYITSKRKENFVANYKLV
jgi:DNA polymerase III sliding clamp (beta) subunit (PCNA family)